MLDVRNIVRHIGWSSYLFRRHFECRPYLIHGSKAIWSLLSLLCVKLLSWILYLIRITVLFCVIGDRYKKSNHRCLITYTCRTVLCGLWSGSCYSDFICNYSRIV